MKNINYKIILVSSIICILHLKRARPSKKKKKTLKAAPDAWFSCSWESNQRRRIGRGVTWKTQFANFDIFLPIFFFFFFFETDFPKISSNSQKGIYERFQIIVDLAKNSE